MPVADAPELLDVAIVKRQRLEDVRQKSIEHRHVGGQRVGAHRPGAFGRTELIESGSFGRQVSIETAGIPRNQQEVLFAFEDLRSPAATERPFHEDLIAPRAFQLTELPRYPRVPD